LDTEEQQVADFAFSAWFASSISARMALVKENRQGKRRDLEYCTLRDSLTEYLKEIGATRPTQ
jgi:hypothetical protein